MPFGIINSYDAHAISRSEGVVYVKRPESQSVSTFEINELARIAWDLKVTHELAKVLVVLILEIYQKPSKVCPLLSI